MRLQTVLRYTTARHFSSTSVGYEKHSCRLLVVGGGSGGCTMAAKFVNKLGKNKVIVLDPATDHYYQPMFTLVGGGMKKLSDTVRPMEKVLPKNAKWLKDEALKFDPSNNLVITKKGDEIKYDFMVVAAGLQLHYEKVPGLKEALELPGSGVCSNYSPKYVNQTYEAIRNFKKGNAIFTFPNSPVKCPGAPQKILYIAEDYFRKHGIRKDANMIYNTSLPVIFGVKHYADALWKIIEERGIKVNTRSNLVEVRPKEKVAVFENLDKPGEKTNIEYALLHATPPQSCPASLLACKDLVDAAGFLAVDKDCLRHVKFSNVFGVGDCINAPCSKTGAAVAGQSGVIYTNLSAAMEGKTVQGCNYDGYSSCPLVTGYGKCIMAEFDYSLTPLETLPIRQDRELALSYYLKTMVLPEIYWRMMLNGHWNGPKVIRKALHLGMGR